METAVYSKIDLEQAIIAKKDILEAQMSLLQAMQKINNFKDLRKKEMMYKLKLKNDVKDIKSKVNKLISQLPQTDKEKTVAKAKHRIKKKKSEERVKSIESQLHDIKQKLADLG